MKNMTRKTSTAKPVHADRGVYEVKTPHITREVEATTPHDLADRLSPLLPDVAPYSVRAAAHLATVEWATILVGSWSVRRTGTMTFIPAAPDGSDSPPRAARGQVAAQKDDGTKE